MRGKILRNHLNIPEQLGIEICPGQQRCTILHEIKARCLDRAQKRQGVFEYLYFFGIAVRQQEGFLHIREAEAEPGVQSVPDSVKLAIARCGCKGD